MNKTPKVVYAESLMLKMAALRLKHTGDNGYVSALIDVGVALDELQSGHMNPPFELFHYDPRTCAWCDGRGTVIDVQAMDNGTIRRQRKCVDCGKKWTTFEIVGDK